ncbi:MAG: DoxX family protein [Pirellulaceae bacterium]|jgi:uncharacterized membrane protein|nr:DoxX family protein [Pirellulaceae bacterium]
MLSTQSRGQFMSLLLLALLFVAAGINHFVNPGFYLKITPDSVPWPLAMIYLSGVFEVLGGIGVLVPNLRRAAGWGLIALLIAVSPVHVDMLVHADRFPEVPMWALVARLLLQPVLIAWVWWTAVKPH